MCELLAKSAKHEISASGYLCTKIYCVKPDGQIAHEYHGYDAHVLTATAEPCHKHNIIATAADWNNAIMADIFSQIAKPCPYCGNKSGTKDSRGGCVSCGAQ